MFSRKKSDFREIKFGFSRKSRIFEGKNRIFEKKRVRFTGKKSGFRFSRNVS